MFVVEFLARLRTLAIRWQPKYLLLSTDDLHADLSIHANGGTVLKLTIAESECAPAQSIAIECGEWNVDTSSMQISQAGSKTISIRMKCEPIGMSSAKFTRPDPVTIARPLSAPEIKGLQRIECADCHQPLVYAADGNIQRCADLPSESWEEFFDCWMCHPDEEQHEKMYNVDLSGRRGLLMSGSTYLLVHDSQLLLDSVNSLSNDCCSSWSPITCSRCQARLGCWRLQRKQNGRTNFNSFPFQQVTLANADAHEVKLWKYAVRVCMPDEQYLSPTFMQCFLYELFEAGRANAYFRFVLREEETDAIRLLLWVFNWDTKVAVGGDSLSGAVRLQDSVRLLYTVIGGDANQLVNQWTESNEQVETLQLPQNLCSRLIGTLQSATEQLPSSEQTAVGGHRLAFLPVSRI